MTGQILELDEALKEAVPAVLWLIEALPPEDPFLRSRPSSAASAPLPWQPAWAFCRRARCSRYSSCSRTCWIDAETQAFLNDLINSVPTAAMVLAVNYRPEYRRSWGGKTCCNGCASILCRSPAPRNFCAR